MGETDGLYLLAVAGGKENFAGLFALGLVDFGQGQNLIAQNRNDLLFYFFRNVWNLAVAGKRLRNFGWLFFSRIAWICSSRVICFEV